MLRRLRRPAALLIPAVLMVSLAACGEESSSDKAEEASADSLQGVTIEGDIGKAPEVTWDGELKAEEIETTVVTEGDGEEVEDGDQVQVHLWVGNGFTQEEAYTSYDAGQPDTVTADDSLSPVFKDAVLGQTIGSRVAVTASAEEAFGEAGNPQLGIGNKDSVLIVVDLIEMYTPPAPKDTPAADLPSVVEKKGEPVALDFSGLPEPDADGELLRAVLEEGDGETVTTEMTIKVDYLGMVYGGKKPFDESYSAEAVEFPLTGVVKGWTYGLAGVKTGSRVLLQIPPALGYGEQEQPGIPANSTLYFVVDVISAK